MKISETNDRCNRNVVGEISVMRMGKTAQRWLDLQWILREEGCGQAEESSKGVLVEDMAVWKDNNHTGLWILGGSVELFGKVCLNDIGPHIIGQDIYNL